MRGCGRRDMQLLRIQMRLQLCSLLLLLLLLLLLRCLQCVVPCDSRRRRTHEVVGRARGCRPERESCARGGIPSIARSRRVLLMLVLLLLPLLPLMLCSRSSSCASCSCRCCIHVPGTVFAANVTLGGLFLLLLCCRSCTKTRHRMCTVHTRLVLLYGGTTTVPCDG